MTTRYGARRKAGMTLKEFQALTPREARRQALGALPAEYRGSFDTARPSSKQARRQRVKQARAIAREPEPRHQHKRRTRRVTVFS